MSFIINIAYLLSIHLPSLNTLIVLLTQFPPFQRLILFIAILNYLFNSVTSVDICRSLVVHLSSVSYTCRLQC